MPTFEIQHPDGRTFEIDGPDATGAANAFRTYNDVGSIFGGGQAPATPPAQPYSFGPVSDAAELGARGINAIVQGVGRIRGVEDTPPRVPQPLGAPINLPLIGQPGIYETAKSAATLPGDVYAGRVDPLSDQGIGRSAELASLISTSPMPSVVRRGPAAAMATPEIKKAGTTAMDVIQNEARAIPLQPGALESFASTVSAHVNQNGPSWKNAEKAHQTIKEIGVNPRGDLGDLIDSRQALKDIVRTGKGQDIRAAQMAIDKIDSTLEPVNPGLVARIKEADKNYAIAEDAKRMEKALAKGIRQAENSGTGGNMGNKVRQAVESILDKKIEKGAYLSPETRAAMENVTSPGAGVNALRPLSAFDPTHSKLGMFGAAALSPSIMANPLLAGAPAAGYASRVMYDRIMRQRAAKIAEAMRAQSPAAMANPAAPGGIYAGRQAPALAQPGILNLGIMPSRNDY